VLVQSSPSNSAVGANAGESIAFSSGPRLEASAFAGAKLPPLAIAWICEAFRRRCFPMFSTPGKLNALFREAALFL